MNICGERMEGVLEHCRTQFPRMICLEAFSFSQKLMFLHVCLGCLAFEPLPQLRFLLSVIGSYKCARFGPLNVQMRDLLRVTL